MGRSCRAWAGIVAGVFCLATVGACTPEPESGLPTAVSSAPAVPVVPNAAAPTAVLRVIDGDTFRTADGLDVRVLGIDACEAATPGGRRATAAARGLLVGAAVTLTTEPGVDRDRYGRSLRYVTANGRDMSEAMITADHTAIYTKGRNDASPERQATLRRLDAGGRSCGADPAPVAKPARPAPVADVDRPITRRPAAVAAPRPAPARTAAPAKPRASKPAPAKPRASSGSGGAGYRNCTAARAAGAAPLSRGQAGYSTKLDRDGDGVACE